MHNHTPAIIYHGYEPKRNYIIEARDRGLRAWSKPRPVVVEAGNGGKLHTWDPDIFRIGDYWYSISGGADPPLFRSRDTKSWKRVGNLFRELGPNVTMDVAKGEDISCPNFFMLEHPKIGCAARDQTKVYCHM